MMQEILHRNKSATIIGSCAKDHTVILKCVLHTLGHIFTTQIRDRHMLFAKGADLICQCLRSFLGIAMDGSIGDKYTLFLRCIAGPLIVEIYVIA